MNKSAFEPTETGGILNEWDTALLKNVAEVNEITVDKNYRFEEIEYIDIASVDDGRVLEVQELALNNAPSRAQRVVRDNDILLSMVRPNLKHFAFIKKSKPNMVASTGFAVISAKKIDPRFLYYYLTTDKYTNYLTAIADAHTSTYPAFNPDVLENSEVPFPPDSEQCAIAKILSDLDEKIELNLQMNKTLESMGQALFKHWFVDFEFPGSGKTRFIHDLPVGWRMSKVGAELLTILGGTPSRTEPRYWIGGTIPWINSGKVNEFRVIEPSEFITEEGLNNSATKIMPKKTTIIAITGATLGQVSLLEISACANQSVIGVLESNNIPSEFIYFWIKENIGILISSQTGGAQQHINKDNVNELNLLCPSKEIINHYLSVSRPLFDQIKTNCFESTKLAMIRDSLLPKLMSGKIRMTQ